MSITRYDCTEDGMEQHPKGDYVYFSDYEEEIDSLKYDINGLREAINNAKDALDAQP